MITSQSLNSFEVGCLKVKLKEHITTFCLRIGIQILTPLIDQRLFTIENIARTRMLVLNENVVFTGGLRTSSFMPFLTKTTSEILNTLKELKHDTYENLNLKFKLPISGVKRAISGFGTLSNLFKKEPEIFDTFLTVDLAYLKGYLKFISGFINKDYNYLNKSEKDNVITFISIFNINIMQLLKIPSPEMVNATINFCIYFPDFSTEEESKKFKALKALIKSSSTLSGHDKKFLIDILNKIVSYKRIIRNLLFDSVIYSIFRYFVAPSFLDYRGRIYSFLSDSLSIQGISYIKAFIKLYSVVPVELYACPIKGTELYSSIKKAIKSKGVGIQMDTKINKRISLTTLISTLTTQYLNTQLKDPFFLKNFPGSDFGKSYQWVLHNIVKKSKALIVHSLLLSRNYIIRSNQLKQTSYFLIDKFSDSKEKNNILGYDVVSSGYQMASILFRDKTMAKMSTLSGSSSSDIYTNCLKLFKENMLKAQPFITKLLTYFGLSLENITTLFDAEHHDLNKYYHENAIVKLNKKGDIESITRPMHSEFFLRKIPITPKDILLVLLIYPLPLGKEDHNGLNSIRKLLLEISTNVEIVDILSDLFKTAYCDFFEEIPNLFLGCFKKGEADSILDLLCKLSVTRAIFRYQMVFEKASYDRRLFKKCIMTMLYGSTIIGRRKSFRETVNEIYQEAGIPIYSYKVSCVIYVLERFLSYFCKNYISGITKLKIIAKILSKYKRPIEIETHLFKCTINPLKTVSRRINFRGSKKSKKISYQLTIRENVLDKDGNTCINTRKQQATLMPNLIHAMDAFVAQFIRLQVYDLVKACNVKNLPLFTTTISIHDSFSFGDALFPFAPFIIRDAYFQLYNLDFIKLIKVEGLTDDDKIKIYNLRVNENDPNYLTKKDINNPHFIKFN